MNNNKKQQSKAKQSKAEQRRAEQSKTSRLNYWYQAQHSDYWTKAKEGGNQFIEGTATIYPTEFPSIFRRLKEGRSIDMPGIIPGAVLKIVPRTDGLYDLFPLDDQDPSRQFYSRSRMIVSMVTCNEWNLTKVIPDGLETNMTRGNSLSWGVKTFSSVLGA